MFRAMEIAASGMATEQTAMNTLADNLANVDTTGFKAGQVQFESLVDTQTPDGVELPEGVQVAASYDDQSQGVIQQTGNPLDLAVNGAGYFPLIGPNGTQLYTRAGSFTLNAQGQIVNPNGLVLAGGITVPMGEQNITVEADGTVLGTPPGSSTPVPLGQIQLAGFANPDGLNDEGQGVFAPTVASGPALTQSSASDNLGLGSIQQGALESSNVNMVQEMVDLISTQRAYESAAKVVATADTMLGYANGLVR